jgi:hypothetical protein
MRRRSTALIVAAIVALAGLAAADALRGRHEPKASAASPTITRPRPPTLREILRREAITGVVVYSDEQCRLHSLLFPGLMDEIVREEGTGEPMGRCRFAVGAGRFLEDDELISPEQQLMARCQSGHVEVLTESGRRLSRVPGCAPAWRPDSSLTYARDGEILLGGGVVLISRADLRKAARAHPNVGNVGPRVQFTVRVLDLAWFDEERVAASLMVLIPGVEPQYFTVVLQNTAVIGIIAFFAGPIRRLVSSPGGAFVAQENGTILERDGGSFTPPEGIPSPHEVAFSPDQRWLALVTRRSVYLVGTPLNKEPGRTIRLPFAANDLAWEPGGPTIDTTTTAR